MFSESCATSPVALMFICVQHQTLLSQRSRWRYDVFVLRTNKKTCCFSEALYFRIRAYNELVALEAACAFVEFEGG